MTKFTLEIDTTGPAFGHWQLEAARILRAVADDLDRDDGRAEAQAAPIPDRFGNPCGLWSHGKELTTTPTPIGYVRDGDGWRLDPEEYDRARKQLTTAQALEIVKLARAGDIGALYAALSGAKPT